MINAINSNNSIPQMNQMQKYQGQGMGRVMQALPQDERENLQQTLKSMDQIQRKNIVSQLKELDVNNLSQNQLLQEVQNILNPTTSAYNFSVYA